MSNPREDASMAPEQGKGIQIFLVKLKKSLKKDKTVTKQ
jgi:hypothetical protein